MTCIGIALGLVLLTCDGGAAPPPVSDAARFCRTARIIRYSASDTAETRRQLRAHNAAYRAACGDR